MLFVISTTSNIHDTNIKPYYIYFDVMVSCRRRQYVPPDIVQNLCTLEQTKSQYGAVTSNKTTDEECDTWALYAGLYICVGYVSDCNLDYYSNKLL
jgi:hypothetical protein